MGAVIAAALAALAALLALNFWGRDDPSTGGTRSFLPMLTAWIGAYLMFGVGLAAQKVAFPPSLVYIGRISYSLYVVHPLVVLAVPQTGVALLSFAVWLGGVLLLSAATYAWVEEPGIAVGQRMVGWVRAARLRPAAAVPTP